MKALVCHGKCDISLRERPRPAHRTSTRTGSVAMMRVDGDVVTGWMNKLRTAIASVTPASVPAAMHARQARPLSASE